MYAFIEYNIGKAFVPAWFIFSSGGAIERNKQKELYWFVVIFKVVIGFFFVFATLYKVLT